MPVPLFASSLDRYKPLLTERMAEVVRDGRYILGPEVEAFEREFADYLGVRHCIGVGNGTDALAVALRALGVGPGDEVVLPSYTFYATAEADRRRGRGAGVLRRRPAHVLRHARDRPARRSRRAPRRSSPSTCSATSPRCPSSGSSGCRCSRTRRRPPGRSWTASMAGALGDAATFSFFPSKNLPCLGDGGAVVTDDDEVAKLARRLRFHGSDDKQTFVEVGYNTRLDELQAAALRVLLPELDGWNAARRAAAVAYERAGPRRARRAARAGRRAPSTSTTCTWHATRGRTSWWPR